MKELMYINSSPPSRFVGQIKEAGRSKIKSGLVLRRYDGRTRMSFIAVEQAMAPAIISSCKVWHVRHKYWKSMYMITWLLLTTIIPFSSLKYYSFDHI